MAENITLNNIATFVNDTTAVNTYNSNNTAIVNAFSDVMSRSGVSPNQMTSTLDMNNQQIINLPFPTTASSPARLIDISGGQITVNTATTGTSGHVVPFLDGANTWSNTQTFTIPSGLSQGLVVNQTTTGSTGGSLNLNSITVADTANAGANTVYGLAVIDNLNSSSVQGQRVAVSGQIQLNAASNAANPTKDYIGIQGTATAFSADGGTNPAASGTSAGEVQGGVFTALAGASATALFAVLGSETNTLMLAGSSTWAKALAAFSSAGADAVAGTVINSMLWLYNHSGAVKWSTGILIDNLGGLGQFPVATTGTLIKTSSAATVGTGIDFTATTFGTNAIVTPAFAVGPTGALSSGQSGIASGSLSLSGVTSGNLTLVSNATATLLTLSQPVQIGTIGSVAGSLTLAGATSGSTALSCSATGSTLQLGGGNLLVTSAGNISTAGSQILLANATAIPAGGTAGVGYIFSSVSNFGTFFGSGAPTLIAAKGSLYLRSDGTTNVTRAYINTDGAATWTAINTVA